jgi:hypothetical protein
MKALTQPERQEIVQILVHRKEVKLAALQASDPGWKQRIEERKNKVALGRLRVEKEACELKLIETQIRDLENRKAALEIKISKKMPLNKRDKYGDSCPTPMSLCKAVSEIAEAVHEAEMAKDATGKKVMAIHAEFDAAKAQLAMCNTREDIVARKVV